jgi:hypothetical protein
MTELAFIVAMRAALAVPTTLTGAHDEEALKYCNL